MALPLSTSPSVPQGPAGGQGVRGDKGPVGAPVSCYVLCRIIMVHTTLIVLIIIHVYRTARNQAPSFLVKDGEYNYYM